MNLIDIDADLGKAEVFRKVEDFLTEKGFRISKVDQTRPWGGFFVLDESQIREFRAMFFEDVTLSEEQLEQKLSPKFLLVAPGARLSWQYHFRRAELWKLINGVSGIVRSETDELGEMKQMQLSETVSLKQGERHRLVGLDTWGIVAEIWMHVDPENPSNEDDIVRVEDDYSRK
ncbi:cupin domain-containing protein [Algoriphagus aquimarinus]|uniref:Mannose-6-phosphate isomerase, cupin superfamily n=1 Tax=Algoriphagus aquimarinus TaxID=237018 RepID=A0A1I0ZL69_9BACT|nr:phosphoheptose isomerase [Algoriphagus aquimarinus]SFB25118.1 Mannose-6-phosphate isomerase, cupin superfamily [Algoriphagus aquimarinus]|tara:strand:- start:70563 stop:71084 length:522 start_codon:yes stop_codon:yes gene_type:complete